MQDLVSRFYRVLVAIGIALVCCQCANKKHIVVDVASQRMVLRDDGEFVKSYPVSTSKFGLGDVPGSKRTPIEMPTPKSFG